MSLRAISGWSFQTLKLGERYKPWYTGWSDSAEYAYCSGQHLLVLFLHNIKVWHVEAVQRSEAEFALITEYDQILFFYRFGREIPWAYDIFSWHYLDEIDRVLPEIGSTEALLNIVLVDAATSVVRVMRTMALSTEFTTHLHRAIYEQATRPLRDSKQVNCELEEISRKYRQQLTADKRIQLSNPDTMIRAAIARTVGLDVSKS